MFKQSGCILIIAVFAFSIFYVKNNYAQIEPIFYDFGQKAVKYNFDLPKILKTQFGGYSRNLSLDDKDNLDSQAVSATQSKDGVDLRLLLGTIPDGAILYQLNSQDSKVSYQINRKFGNRRPQSILSVNNNLQGFGWHLVANKEGQFYIQTDVKKFISDNPQMDLELINYLEQTNILVESQIFDIDQENSEIKTTVNVTFNGVIKAAPIKCVVTIIDSGYKVSGNFDIKLSDFNVKPPFLKDVYTIDDQIKIIFEIKLDKSNY